jgi:hypothetical protein
MKTKRGKAKIRVGQKRRSAICSEPEQRLEILRPDAAGIDCAAEEHYIAVPPDRVRAGEATVRCFGAFTEGLDAAVDWLKACRITTVAMEPGAPALAISSAKISSAKPRLAEK